MHQFRVCVVAAITVVAAAAFVPSVAAQTETVIFNFRSGGMQPGTNLIIDQSGALYGMVKEGANGEVFVLNPPAGAQTKWTETILRTFTGTSGFDDWGGLFADTNGNLYGSSSTGGTGGCSGPNLVGCGYIFSLTSPVPPSTTWSPRKLFSFPGTSEEGVEGVFPQGGVITDNAAGKTGALYGTTSQGGTHGGDAAGTVFELVPPVQSNGVWREKVIHTFHTRGDGATPQSNLIADASGALYGTTEFGGAFGNTPNGGGTVFMMTPPASLPGAWTETVLHSFSGTTSDGSYPSGGVIKDVNGNLYGVTTHGGAGACNGEGFLGCGTVYELTPPGSPGGNWSATVLYSFAGLVNGATDGFSPAGSLVMDSSGALYGTTTWGGDVTCANGNGMGCGIVYKLAPPASPGGNWTETVLHRFAGGATDGGIPNGGLVADSHGAYYGTTETDGIYSLGTAFKIVP